jgi:hypothetical protein
MLVAKSLLVEQLLLAVEIPYIPSQVAETYQVVIL